MLVRKLVEDSSTPFVNTEDVRITRLHLMDASTTPATDLGALMESATTISLSEIGTEKLSIEARVTLQDYATADSDSGVEVVFTETNTGGGGLFDSHVANGYPYALKGASTVLTTVGSYTVTATASQGGVGGNTVSLTLTIVP